MEKAQAKEAPQGVQKMVSLTINGKAIQAKAGTSVFEAAADAGIFIPHYCYHKDLSIAGVCRMCMCEVEKAPKLQISCNTTVAEGMVVRTDTQKVKDTVKSVLELHLINHPLDCPICDKAGECKLQDYYADYGLYQSRMEFDAKTHKPKVVDIGTIVLDAERCILCTRCVRFTAEVTKTNELGIFNRGDRSTLKTYDDQPLRNEYTGNLADICPVGALTAKDFRFRQRVWFLEKEATTCTLCAHGCSTTASMNPTTRKMFRVEPRRNPDVNSSWICDRGRWNFHYANDEKRIKVPRRMYQGKWTEIPWNEAFGLLNDECTATPERVLVGLSTQLTNEEIADSVATLQAQGIGHFTWIVDESVVADRKPSDGLLKHRDFTVNALGFERTMKALGAPWMKRAEAEAKLKAGAFDRLLLVGLEGYEMPGAKELVTAAPASVKIAAHVTSETPWFERCDLILPNVSSYEKRGTVMTALGRLQKVNGVLPRQYTARDAHALVFGLERGDDREQVPAARAQSVFENVIVERILMGHDEKWRTFRPMGVPLEGGAHAS